MRTSSAKMFSIFFLWISIFVHQDILAHGEHESGPNGGLIRMPGGFHTELIVLKDGLKVYLLDIEFKNPSTKNGALSAKIVRGKSEQKLQCQSHPDHFFCPVSDLPAVGKIVLKATREKMEGIEAVYDLPVRNVP
ncbi:hypothetical protein EHQ12_07670 [Leptospira gomenensis]|uniref:Uncharacterized protein n=1 Tax=Leptospira gomenensis TaxID=2484974 RepID=A0A5F1YB67_9LEPT|nr:hypothetical protein [Leptospira gomenensis]TGK34560.1 hypothetical protein EHQ17_09065 [Leptospira gomenensis]TGK40130.1 hypothetical protein EHQ07_18835 [Leptospira gomenensis]TGK40459.1 hypothetical protein EHQ12_07670 [Leptospira gomenensis]TGK55639.1 hypothetical protein EHQ13_17060 [Leptospira gomenensis]